LNELQSQ
jgi:hypothetical protein